MSSAACIGIHSTFNNVSMRTSLEVKHISTTNHSHYMPSLEH